MSDPFNILGDFGESPAVFSEAYREAVGRLATTAARFEALQERVPEEAYTPEEWGLIEAAAAEVAEAVERAEEGYVAVAYDSHAWYRIMENLERVRLRLESAMGVMERARERQGC